MNPRPVLAQLSASATGRLGLALTAGIVACALFAPLLATHDPNQLDVPARFAPPSLMHWLGTDHLGRDLYSRVLYGARIAMWVALATSLLAFTLGALLGIAAAYAPPVIERLFLVVFDIVAAFPSLVLALALVAVLGPSLANVIIIVTMTLIPYFGRVARAQTLALRHAPFLEAERALGASTPRIALSHVLPNILGPLIVLASMNVPTVITIEAGLSFLGVGVRPPRASWGTLLYDGYIYLSQSYWPVLWAGLALAAATLGFTLLGEALRDALDPKARGLP
ncbi:MAG: ABC transporter permease [Gammaproteobacteria bacterium]